MEPNMNNPIPVECYDEIFFQLKDDRKALYSCIFVNQFFCRLAMPLLWGTPFKHVNLNNPKAPIMINTYIRSLVAEDKTYLQISGLKVESMDDPFFPYPEFLTSFNSQVFQILMDKWLRLVDPFNYSVNYQYKIKYASYIVSNLLFASTTKLESLKYFRLNPNDEMTFIKHKEFEYSISKLVNLEIDYLGGENGSSIQNEEKLNDLFNILTCYTYSVRFVKINITSPNDPLFTTRVIKSIANFISHQYKLESLSFNESLISENLSDFEEIVNLQATNLKYLRIGGTLKNFAKILKVLRNCVNLKLLEFGGEEIVAEDYMMEDVEIWDRCNYDEGSNCEVSKVGEISTIENFEFNQLKIENIYCIEDCASVGCNTTYEDQQIQLNGNGQSPNFFNNDIFSFSLDRILIMTNVNLRTLNLGKINSIIITTLGKYCYRLTHLSCEVSLEDFLSFVKLLEVLKELEHLKLKLKLSSMIINDNYILAFSNSLSNSLQKLGFNIYDEGENNDFMFYFLKILLENLFCNNLYELEFYNDQMIRNDYLQLVLNFALTRNGFGDGSGGGTGGGIRDCVRFKSFRYARKNYGIDFDHTLLQNGREFIQIECEEISDFHRPFYEPFCYEKD